MIWAWIVRARLWPAWYPNSSGVKILTRASSDLFANARFTWRTFGVRLVSQVKEFLPCERIAWDAVGVAVRAYHAWLIVERPRRGSATDACNNGRDAMGLVWMTESVFLRQIECPPTMKSGLVNCEIALSARCRQIIRRLAVGTLNSIELRDEARRLDYRYPVRRPR